MSNPLLEARAQPRFGAIRPEHVEPAVAQVLAENRAAIEALLADPAAADFDSAILPLEELADRLHRTWSPVSHLNSVANSPELRAAYNACLPELSRYSTEIAQDERLFALYQQAASRLDAGRQDGARALLDQALRDFRLGGVALPAAEKQRFRAIMEELSQLHARFDEHVLDAMAAWQHHERDAARLAGLPESTREAAAAAAREAGLDGWLFRLNQPNYVAVTTHAEDRELRRAFYRAWVTRASDQADWGQAFDNSPVIERILALRHEAAGLVGFDNFAEYSLATKMAGSVAEVHHFLAVLGERSRAAAAREFAELQRFAGHALEAFDVAFYSERLRRERYAVSDEELKPYFPLERVLAGLFGLVERLYGVRVEAIDGVDAWDPQVRYFALHDTGGTLGGFYTDLFARPIKRSGAWMDECALAKRLGGERQLPVAHLVCNFAPPTAQHPSLLTHDEVLTLFHEFGHTLHHLLTRVNYPSVSGINGVPWDAVELPSQFMENFAWEPEVVAMISGHYRTGEPLPDAVLARLRESRVFQAGMQMVRQLEFALFDLRLHAEYRPAAGGRVAELLDAVRAQVAVVRQPAFNRFAHAFSHIFGGGYAAGYYSYKWAEVLAADAWAAFEEHGIFDTGIAGRFRREILEIGGTEDIGAAFAAFRGRPADVEPLLQQTGILQHEGASGELAG